MPAIVRGQGRPRYAALERKSDEQYRQVMKVIERLVAPASKPPPETSKRIGFDKPKGRRS